MGGWSAVGGQAQSAYTTDSVDLSDNLLGHSMGNEEAASLLTAPRVSHHQAPQQVLLLASVQDILPLAVGTDTGGSIITPSTRAALYSLRPTMGLISQDGLIPLSHHFDTAGPMAKSVTDLANLLDVLVTPRSKDVGNAYSEGLVGSLSSINVGFLAPEKWYFSSDLQRPIQEATAQIISDTRAAYAKLARTAKSAKEVSLISVEALEVNGRHSFYDIQMARFKPALERYLGALETSQVRSLDEIIKFNKENSAKELPPHYNNQDQLLSAATMRMSEEEHDFLLHHARKVSRDLGIDKTLQFYGVDVIVAPADSPVNLLVSAAGYPSATMPLSYLGWNGRPIGLVAFTTAYGEEILLNFLYAYEKAFPERFPPHL